MAVSPAIRKAVDDQRIKLAAIELPAITNEQERLGLKDAIEQCFVFGFRRVMLTGAALGFASSLTAWLIIRNR